MVIEERRLGGIITQARQRTAMTRKGTPKQSDTPRFIIDEEFRDWLDPLLPEVFEALERDIVKFGCRDPLVLWKEQNVLIDGHHRHAICEKHNLPYGTTEMSFKSREDVLIWILDNQTARRNLTLFQRVEVVLRFKPRIATKAKANQKASGGAVPAKVKKPVDTYEVLSKLAKTSPNTVRKVEYILDNASKRDINVLRRGEAKTSINSIYEGLLELEEEKEAEFTPKSKKKASQRNSRVLPKAEKQPTQDDLDHEINNVIEVLMEVEERLPLDCVNIYAELEDWIRNRKTEIVKALVSK